MSTKLEVMIFLVIIYLFVSNAYVLIYRLDTPYLAASVRWYEVLYYNLYALRLPDHRNPHCEELRIVKQQVRELRGNRSEVARAERKKLIKERDELRDSVVRAKREDEELEGEAAYGLLAPSIETERKLREQSVRAHRMVEDEIRKARRAAYKQLE